MYKSSLKARLSHLSSHIRSPVNIPALIRVAAALSSFYLRTEKLHMRWLHQCTSINTAAVIDHLFRKIVQMVSWGSINWSSVQKIPALLCIFFCIISWVQPWHEIIEAVWLMQRCSTSAQSVIGWAKGVVPLWNLTRSSVCIYRLSFLSVFSF